MNAESRLWAMNFLHGVPLTGSQWLDVIARPMQPILLLCPLDLELKALLNELKGMGHEAVVMSQQKPLVSYCESLNMYFAVGGHGKTQFGIQTQFYLYQLKNLDIQIGTVICAGAAGALHAGVNAFDVVAATKTIEHDFRLKFLSRPDPEFLGHPELLEKIKSVNAKNFSIHLGPIASGDEDILDETRANELAKQTLAIAVAWEGAGGARACAFNKIPFLELRGVTDSSNASAVKDFKTNLEIAMANVAKVLIKSF